jgi:hypothetical protein
MCDNSFEGNVVIVYIHVHVYTYVYVCVFLHAFVSACCVYVFVGVATCGQSNPDRSGWGGSNP